MPYPRAQPFRLLPPDHCKDPSTLGGMLALLAPEAVARAAHAFVDATDRLGKRIQATGGWDGTQIAAEYDAWKQAEHELINAARVELGGR